MRRSMATLIVAPGPASELEDRKSQGMGIILDAREQPET
jgi:hypothetical protein